MNTDNKLNNKVFTDAIIGVLLSIGALAFSLLNQTHIKTFQPPYIAILATLATAGLFLLAKSIKEDQYRYDDFVE